MKLIKSSLGAINSIIEGYDTENICSIYAPSTTGKTLLLVQEAYCLAKATKKKVLFLDSEGGIKRFLAKWGEIFINKYEAKESDIVTELARSPEKLLELHGVNIELAISDKGHKMSGVKVKEIEFEKIPIVKLIKQKKIGTVIYDSMTAPFEKFGTRTVNLAARSDVQGYLFTKMLEIMDRSGVIVLVSHHSSINPQKPFDIAKIKGGSGVWYHSKIIIYLERFKGNRLANYRKIHLVRFPNKASWSVKHFCEYTDDGIVDISDEEMQNILDAGKKKKESD